MLKVNNKDTRKASIVDFEQVNVIWVAWIDDWRLGFLVGA